MHKKNIHGILLLDKPQNLSSQQTVTRVKSLFSSKKAGHTGSLDPIATGLLPICFGEATKFARFLLETDKHYAVTIKLGIQTSTGDCEGETLIEKKVPPLTRGTILTTLSRFQGQINQIPPLFSALKYQGKPLYHWARQGIEVQRTPRSICIKSLTLIAYTTNTLTLEVQCSKGTYIRSLAEDIGHALGCGAHVVALRRLSVGTYSIEKSISIEKLEHLTGSQALMEWLLPLEEVFSDWPSVEISEAARFYLYRGQALELPETPSADWICLLSKHKKFLGMGRLLKDGRITPYRMLQNEAV